MRKNFLSWYWELNFIVFAYTIGNILFAIVYLISFLVWPLKSIILEYNETGSNKSVLIINFVSTSVFTMFFVFIEYYLNPLPQSGFFEMLLVYIAWLFLGFFALYLLADYKRKPLRKAQNNLSHNKTNAPDRNNLRGSS